MGIMGPSGVGKTFSALRLGSGMRDVVGGKLHVIDTENGRALHYADHFDFQHVPFSPLFSPDDYLAALQHCVADGAKTIVVDSQSHEHEGLGGVLEWHESEMSRMSKGDESRRDKFKFSAWIEPKAARQRLINGILQLQANIIFCFRAKEKLKVIPGKQPEPLGWMPIAGDEFLYEMTTCVLLMPGANGVPTWNPREQGERAMIKRPMQFDELLRRFDGKQLCEQIGAEMAQWAKGDVVRTNSEPTPAPKKAGEILRDEIDTQIGAALSHVQLDALASGINAAVESKKFTHKTADWLLAKIETKRLTLADDA
jgi:hypothetical protein